jgi:F0F1-type ATP synthase membrane subunit c/vacuolar-type H+-ATPase subunit K
MQQKPRNLMLTWACPLVAACSTTHMALAQRRSNPNNGAGIFACCGSAAIAIPIAIIALNIAMLVWVARDAKSRGMENSIIWMLLVLATSFIGLIIYVFVRPEGEFVACSNCGEKKLPKLVRCPHCGAGA